MRSPIHLLSLSALLLSALTPASAEGPPSSNSARTQKVYLHQWPLSASTPTPLATITYNQLSGHASFASFSPPPPPPPSSDEIIRIGLLQKDGEWVGTVTDQKSLADREKVEVTLWVDEVKGDVWRVEFLHNYNASSTGPTVRTRRATPGPVPVLNRPVVLTPEGRLPEVEMEKTFLQK